mgnify:CR=1 FL=1
MSHPLCGTEVAPGYCGFQPWNGKATYIRAVIDSSVQHHQALGEAIHRWNLAVGARFLIVPDHGEYTITFLGRKSTEPPFAPNLSWAGAITELISGNPRIYLRTDMGGVAYYEYVNMGAHEIGHALGLADHAKDDINSIMSYQVSGRWLLSPSKEDVDSIAALHGLERMAVRPQELDGIENVSAIWHYDRYHGQGWRWWTPWNSGTVESLIPYENYWVKAKAEGLLGLRMPLHLEPGINRWAYL